MGTFQPDAKDSEVKVSVNNMLKAITCSLLMEQVMAPHYNFKPRFPNDDTSFTPGEIKVNGFKAPSTDRVREIIESDINDLKASILQDDQIIKALPGNVDPEVINKVMIPKIIQILPILKSKKFANMWSLILLLKTERLKRLATKSSFVWQVNL
jgi:hypothetical protein